ncbi:MAG: helix-turn-helix domain-containing protein [Lachnospiraceae bacterium]|nr:helix-turn-helix domain-containing protein [Lachnospiraceae bacterium]
MDGNGRWAKKRVMLIPTIDMVRTGENINRLRKLAGVSVKDLQDVFGFATPQAIYKWQRGTTLPTIDNMIVLATVLGVKIDEILVTTEVQVSMSA